jgi:acyl transferase domain-containing protein
MNQTLQGPDDSGIAVIGMSCRFPGAADVERYWKNLREGRESIRFFGPDELEPPWRSLANEPNFVPASGFLDDIQFFDRELFGMSEREALLADPQHRLFLQAAWDALDHAGYGGVGARHGPIALYAGSWLSSYAARTSAVIATAEDEYLGWLLNAPDFLATYASFKLNLTGESMAVQSACSTGLVAVHLACQSLLSEQCDMALAGGVAIDARQRVGYLYRPGGLLSPDGRCRPFDRAGLGTVPGHGLGLVVLKRLPDAIRDGDHCYAVIRSTAVGNDGHRKIGLQAPSVDGLTEVAATAIALAGVPTSAIGFVETHGGATPIGDAIELEALTRAFDSDRKETCAVGSVKSNFGDLVQAGGIAAFIKTVLAVYHGEIPPTLHFERPTARFDFARSPFYVNRETRPWGPSSGPRLAGVAASGIGGTNAFAVVGQAPPEGPRAPHRRERYVVPLSAQTDGALGRAKARLLAWLDRHPEARLADIAFTLGVGRAHLPRRDAWIADSVRDLIAQLGQADRRQQALPAAADELEGLRRAWCGGADIDWALQYPAGACRRVPLPGYPFEREPFWLDEAADAPASPRGFIPWMGAVHHARR